MSETPLPSPTGGLRGQSAGSTAICTVGKSGVGLTYRGYAIEDLAEHATFEEVAFLLLEGTLPNQQQLAEFKKRLRGFRFLPSAPNRYLNGWGARARRQFFATGPGRGAAPGLPFVHTLLLVSLYS
jgi:citrate synthase